MRALSWVGLAALALFFLASTALQRAIAAPTPASGVWVEYVGATGDSVRYAARWTPPQVGPDQRPLAAFDVQIVRVDPAGQTVLTSKHTAQVSAVLAIARPSPGDSLGPLVLQVRSVDISGAVSGWATTAPWTVTHEAIPPSPPLQVQVDSGTVALDSVILRPRVVAMEEGTAVKLCLILFPTGGSPGLTLEDSARPECLAVYNTWVAVHTITA